MAEVQSGISYSELNSAISSLRNELRGEIRQVRSELQGEINDLQRWTEREIKRLEDEMKEIGVMIVGAISQQTVAIVSGVAATTVMIERTKRQIEEDFNLTRDKIEIQTESTLQIEVGKKVADASALKSKLAAFFSDVKARFDKSISGVALNRELYNLNFQKISDEYTNKIETIGQHIFQVKLEDIAPAVKAAHVPYEEAHSLPIEMDLKRLSARSANLDETLGMLKSSRLDEVVKSLDTLDSTLSSYGIEGEMPGENVFLCVEGIVTTSAGGSKILAGLMASQVGSNAGVSLSLADQSLGLLSGEYSQQQARSAMSARKFKDISGEDVIALSRAASELRSKNLISADAHALFEDFLGSGNLKYLEA
jgi:hypothetical protein